MAHYTQLLARTDRATQALAALKGLDVYMFPHTPAGTLICERISEALDVRIIVQVAREIAWNLGHGYAVLAIAGDEGTGFWCGLFEGGVPRFAHNRLTGPQDFADKPASPADVDLLCSYFGAGVNTNTVYQVLAGGHYESAVARHAALAEALGLPSWSPGVGYSRILDGGVPPEAGTPSKPPRYLKELRPTAELREDIGASDPLERFHQICEREFSFLKEDFGFRKEPGRYSVNHYPQVINNIWIIGPGHLRPGYKNAYMVCYRSRHLIIVIEGLSFGGKTRLCLIDQSGRHLDLTTLVMRRDPELLDLCQLADNQSEQIPIFAEALRKCAFDVLAGDLRAISCIAAFEAGFSFSAFSSKDDGDYILALYGPRGKPRTIWAQIRRTILLRKTMARIRSGGQ